MTDEDKISLSRRKALGAMGTIGAAGALGTMGTFAQFSDTEDGTVSFTAGGIDGRIGINGSYNETSLGDSSVVTIEDDGISQNGVSFEVKFEDIKPGDFGCFNFGITVQNNSAWVASCLDVVQDIDYKDFEPEIEADTNVTSTNVDNHGDLSGQANGAEGDLAERILTIPYYDSDSTCDFFDSKGPQAPSGSVKAPGPFWSNSENKNSAHVGGDNYLAPQSLQAVSQTVQAVNTQKWNADNNTLKNLSAPNGASVGAGCVLLDGGIEDKETGDNTRPVTELPPGKKLNFGYDFHLPFGTGNIAQGDRLKLKLGFVFLQSRHTSAPNFDEYDPGSNTRD